MRRSTDFWGAAIALVIFGSGIALGIYVTARNHGLAPAEKAFEIHLTASSMSPSPVTVGTGDQVVLTFWSNVSETVDLSGYNQRFDIHPGAPVAITFVAGQAGTFNVTRRPAGNTLGKFIVKSP